jgi:hypothetical protein
LGNPGKLNHAKYSVNTKFVKVSFDIDCKWKRGPAPAYRVYVNDELFTERTWIWQGYYLNEMLQISAAPGEYRVRVEAVQPIGGKFKTRNYRVDHGDAQWRDTNILEILP